jgi:hypothetical protein
MIYTLLLEMFPLLFLVAHAKQIKLFNETITKVRLENDDSLLINAINRSAFIQIQTYFFRGEFTITAVSDAQRIIHTGFPGDRLSFTNCELTLSLCNSFTSCTVSIYLLPSICEPRASIHSRSILSAVSTMRNDFSSFCWFYDFVSVSPTFAIDGFFEVVQTSESGVLKRMNLSLVEELNQSFVLIGYPGSGSVTFSTDRLFCDWNERDRPFQECGGDSGNCELPNVNVSDYLISVRSVAGWIWFLLYGIPSLIACVFIGVILMSPSKVKVVEKIENTSRPLISDCKSESLQIDPVRYI